MLSLHETGLPGQSNERDPDILIKKVSGQTLADLETYYAEMKPDKSEDAFIMDVFLPMSDDLMSTGESRRTEFFAIVASKAPVDVRFAALMVSCAFCIDVARFLHKGKRELAWQAISDAQYWCGFTFASKGFEVIRDETILATRKSTGQNAANVRVTKKLSPTMHEAFRLARKMRPAVHGWNSRSQAVHAIIDLVVAFSDQDMLQPLKRTGAPKTIDGWLSQMPDAKDLFTKKTHTKD